MSNKKEIEILKERIQKLESIIRHLSDSSVEEAEQDYENEMYEEALCRDYIGK